MLLRIILHRIFRKHDIISGNSRFNEEKASGNSRYPHHVSMFQVCLVLQQLPHYIDVALLSCRDQRRPAVLHIEDNLLPLELPSDSKSSWTNVRALQALRGTPRELSKECTYQLVIPGAHLNRVSHGHTGVSES